MQSLRFVSLLGLIVAFGSSLALAQQGSVKGKVTDEAGAPIPAANVLIEGTVMGASTEANGEYTIPNVPPGTYSLRIGAVGYRTKSAAITITAGQTVTQDASLAEDILNFDAVIVTGVQNPKTKLQSSVAITTMSNLNRGKYLFFFCNMDLPFIGDE